MTVADPITHAVELRAQAREHKRAEREHRRKARAVMDELRLHCERCGIAFETTDRDPGGQSLDGHRRT